MSEVYTLHRETAYLAQDFFDRFMLTQDDMAKDRLQLIGITALFIASKMEVGVMPSVFMLFWMATTALVYTVITKWHFMYFSQV